MLKIDKATYGDVDCTELIKSKVVGEKLIIRSSNSLIGDPNPGTVKYLVIKGTVDGVGFEQKVKEGVAITIPKSATNKLGIFYSNNNNHSIWPAIQKSLDTIKNASQDKVDIITCVWERMPNNPFQQIDSWYKSQSHLNQLLQIMQCLYTAKETGTYEYVSFLEHDVLYPEGYFDYPEFERGHIYTNMNYGGLCREGWQKRNQDDEPFHQMTMRFEDAIEHCERILPNALVTNSGMIEPEVLRRKQWESKNEAIHINHGIHFTSHNSIYKKDNPEKIHPYWEDYQNYLYLFN